MDLREETRFIMNKYGISANKRLGQNFLIDDYEHLSVLPLEVKSGKDYYVHSALDHFLKNDDYSVKRGIVFCNEGVVEEKGGVTYMPVYNVMFLNPEGV